MTTEAPTDEMDLQLIKSLLLSYSPQSDLDLVTRAFEFSREAHAGQLRRSGEPYLSHPIEVAIILAEHCFDGITLAAALLHDVIEDCGVTEEQLTREFGAEIVGLVVGVSKLSSLAPRSQLEMQAENFRRMFVAVARDIRILVIKLADRLHNMRTIGFLRPDKIERISRETLEIYAPLADRMGMHTIRMELEDLSFRHLMPDKYAEIAAAQKAILGERQNLMEEATRILTARLGEAGIEAKVISRTKEIYSIYRKMQKQGRKIEEIYDLLAMRILVETLRDCYGALGIVHTLWKPIPMRFKDYIAMPKANMYQSLHTTVFGPSEGPLEIQIRTHQMHLVAEEGIAAHWKYKASAPVDERLGWLKQILEWQRDAVTPREFMDSLRTDLYSERVFVLTPKGRIIELPAGGTPIDVAFHIHTEVGAHITGARVDGRLVPINSELKSGAVVEILTSPTAKPSRDWLDIVKSPRARSKIRHLLREKGADDLRRHGAELLQQALSKARLRHSVAQRSEELLKLSAQMAYESFDALLEAIGFGSESAQTVANRLLTYEEKQAKRGEKESPAVKPKDHDEVLIEGMSDMMIRYGHCCNPMPGDAIMGYLSRGRGVTVHRANCPNLKSLASESARFVKASWSRGTGKFTAGIKVDSADRIGLLADLTQAIAKEGGNIVSAEIKTKGISRDSFCIEVSSSEHLDRIIKAMEGVDGVHRVERALAK